MGPQAWLFYQMPAIGTTTKRNELTVEVRNGTQTSGLGQKIADSLKDLYTVQKISDAKKKDYIKTIVVDLGKIEDKSSINTLAQTLNAEVVSLLPEGELVSPADVLIVVGTDKTSL